MKRLVLAVSLVALATAACKKAEQTPPPADTTAAPAAAPAPAMDAAKSMDSTKRDTSQANPAKKPN